MTTLGQDGPMGGRMKHMSTGSTSALEVAADLVDQLDSGHEEAPTITIKRIGEMLHGRYVWAVPLAVVLAIVGVLAGWFLPTPVYRSDGKLQFSPVIPKALDEDAEVRPMFEAWVNAQASMIMSERVVSRALANPSWETLGVASHDSDFRNRFQKSLEVSHPKRSQMVQIGYSDSDKGLAKIAVESIIRAYEDVHSDEQMGENRAVIQILDEEIERYKTELKTHREQISDVTSGFGVEAVEDMRNQKLTDLSEKDTQLKKIELRLRELERVIADEKESSEKSRDPLTESEWQIVLPNLMARYPDLRELVRKQRLWERTIRNLEDRFGQRHKKVIEAKAILGSITQAVQDFVEHARRSRIDETPMGDDTSPAGLPPAHQYKFYEMKHRMLQSQVEKLRREAANFGQQVSMVKKLADREAGVREKMRQAEDRRDELTIINQIGGRLQVISYGEEPLKPFKDRRKVFAVGGFVFGIVGAFAAAIGVGLMDQRFRNPNDAISSIGSVRMLGILPSLPEDLSDPTQAQLAAHCVHQVRTQVQLGSGLDDRPIFAVTSPSSGDGKTSLALALGTSFAAAGSRTLLIDCDMIAAGLTSRVDAIVRRKFGQILVRAGLVSEEQVSQALSRAQSANQRLGEALVDLGFLGEQDISSALSDQAETTVGLLDFLEGEPLKNCVADTGIPNLSILPVGAVRAQDVTKLSPSAMHNLAEAVRNHFDTIVIDTGPILESLEASVVAAEADRVMLVVSRGTQRPQSDRAIERLRTVQASLAGVVFNRAEPEDVDSYHYVGKYSVESNAAFQNTMSYLPGNSTRFGPIAQAVVTSSRPNEDTGQSVEY